MHTFEVTEMMGAETYLYLELAGEQFTARVNQRSTAKIGDTIKVAFETNKFISLIRIQNGYRSLIRLDNLIVDKTLYGFVYFAFMRNYRGKGAYI